MNSSLSPVKNLFFKKSIVVIYFIAWLFTAFLNPFSISTLLVPFLFVVSTTYVFFCRRDYGISTWIFLLFVLFAVNFLVNGIYMNKESIRWLLSFWCCLLTAYFLFKICGHKMIMSIYGNMALIISFFCILQQLSFFVGLDLLYELSWLGIDSRVTFAGPFLRGTAFFAEPAHLGFFLIYPCFLAIVNKPKARDYIILAAYFMTFSIGNYLMLMLLLLGYYLFIGKKISLKSLLLLFVLCVVFVVIVLYVPEVQQKLSSIFAADEEMWLPENRSKLAIYLLYSVNLDSFLDNPIFGNGFGTRLDIYQQYFPDVLSDFNELERFVSDENFFAKILGEMGGAGLAVFFFIFYRRWKIATNDNKISLLVFLIISLKSGSYFNPALFFFMNMFLVDSSRECIYGSENRLK